MEKTDREIIASWKRQRDGEDNKAYKGRISLGPLNHVANAVMQDKA
jgi:hypothetical protein